MKKFWKLFSLHQLSYVWWRWGHLKKTNMMLFHLFSLICIQNVSVWLHIVWNCVFVVMLGLKNVSNWLKMSQTVSIHHHTFIHTPANIRQEHISPRWYIDILLHLEHTHTFIKLLCLRAPCCLNQIHPTAELAQLRRELLPSFSSSHLHNVCVLH